MTSAMIVELEKISKLVNLGLFLLLVLFGFLGVYFSPFYHIGTVVFFVLNLFNFYYLFIQKEHTVLRNFGIFGQIRYMFESVGPEFRQYFFMSDTQERPFTRDERSEVYRKAKDIDSSLAFGSLKDFGHDEIKILHSMFPTEKSKIKKYSLTFGEERGIRNKYTIDKPFMISAMSYGALGKNAVRSLARGAKMSNTLMNTGEGGFP